MQSADSMMLGQGEQILILERKRGQASRLSRDLRSAGYATLLTNNPERALELLSRRHTDLIIVVGTLSARTIFSDERYRTSEDASLANTAAHWNGGDVLEVCQLLKTDGSARQIPLLLVASVWEDSVLLRGLEGGADYLLFAPYHPQALLRNVRNALLNGAAPAPAVEDSSVEIIHQDRIVTVSAGPDRLARMLFSLYEDLRQTRALHSWRQAELQQLQEQLRRDRHQMKREALLKEMIGGVGHDLGNLIETLSAAIAVIVNASPEAAPYRAALEAELAQAEALVSVLQNFALFGEETLPVEPLDLGEVVQDVVTAALLLLRAPKIRVELRTQGLPAISSNRDLLSRCLNNLIWNAIQAMPSGGTLRFAGAAKNGHVTLEVSDTGPGIPRHSQQKIFDSSYSRKPGHPGLGLAIVRGLLQRVGGGITVASQRGRGATFRLAFPVADVLSEPLRLWSAGEQTTSVG